MFYKILLTFIYSNNNCTISKNVYIFVYSPLLIQIKNSVMSRHFWSSANGVFYSIELKGEIFNLVRGTFYYPTLSKKYPKIISFYSLV